MFVVSFYFLLPFSQPTYAQRTPLSVIYEAHPDTLFFGTIPINSQKTLLLNVYMEFTSGEVRLTCPVPFTMIIGKDSALHSYKFPLSNDAFSFQVYCSAAEPGQFNDTLVIDGPKGKLYVRLNATVEFSESVADDMHAHFLFTIFPNPSNSSSRIILDKPALIEVFDLLGRSIATSAMPLSEWTFFPTSPGTYFIRAKTKSADGISLTQTKKLIVQ